MSFENLIGYKPEIPSVISNTFLRLKSGKIPSVFFYCFFGLVSYGHPPVVVVAVVVVILTVDY